MRIFGQLISLWLSAATLVAGASVTRNKSNNSSITTNRIQRFVVVQNQVIKPYDGIRALKKVFLSNRTITCNDGSQAGFYLRKSHTSKKWIIYLEGGWYCYDNQSCRNRWIKQRHYMTSSNWPDTRDFEGILSANSDDNPFWWNANHVFIPYCTSDSWSGTKLSSLNKIQFSFMGSEIVQQVVKDIVPLGLENSTDLTLAGSSAGGTGVMINLDRIKKLLHKDLDLKQIIVKGITDSGWFLDRTPFAPTLKPAVDAIRKGMDLWHGRVPEHCRNQYIKEPWRCYFGYRIYPTLKTELFVFQWLFDEAQMDVDNVGAPVTKQQWDYIHKMGDALRQSFENVSALFAPSCISHSILTKHDWISVKIDDISIAEAIHCWEQKIYRKRNRRINKERIIIDIPTVINEQINITKLEISRSPNVTNNRNQRKRKRRKHRKNQRGRRRKDCQRGHNLNCENRISDSVLTNTSNPSPSERCSFLCAQTQKRNNRKCVHRRIERCTWPQCNRSCPQLHNPLTGEEMDFIELLKSFGLDMESVAKALSMDIQTLNNMDHAELLNLLIQHVK